MMITQRHLIIAILLTFSLTATLFMIIPTKSDSSNPEYDPWVDLNDDGEINILDLVKVAIAFGTSGEPINKTELLMEIQSRLDRMQAEIDSLNASFRDHIQKNDQRIHFFNTTETEVIGTTPYDLSTFYWCPSNASKNVILSASLYIEDRGDPPSQSVAYWINIVDSEGTIVMKGNVCGHTPQSQWLWNFGYLDWENCPSEQRRPNQSNYTIRVFALPESPGYHTFARNVNVILEVLDG